jgi:hypothetical protein
MPGILRPVGALRLLSTNKSTRVRVRLQNCRPIPSPLVRHEWLVVLAMVRAVRMDALVQGHIGVLFAPKLVAWPPTHELALGFHSLHGAIKQKPVLGPRSSGRSRRTVFVCCCKVGVNKVAPRVFVHLLKVSPCVSGVLCVKFQVVVLGSTSRPWRRSRFAKRIRSPPRSP